MCHCVNLAYQILFNALFLQLRRGFHTTRFVATSYSATEHALGIAY